MLRDGLLCRIRNKTMQRRLLQETTLSFDKALGIALSAEAAEDTKRLTGGTEDKNLATPIETVKDRPNTGIKGNCQRN